MSFGAIIRDFFIAVILSAIVVGVMVANPAKVESAFGRFDADLNWASYFNSKRAVQYESQTTNPIYAKADNRVGPPHREKIKTNSLYSDPRVSKTADIPWLQ